MHCRSRGSDSQCNSVHEKIEKQKRPMKKPRNSEKEERLKSQHLRRKKRTTVVNGNGPSLDKPALAPSSELN